MTSARNGPHVRQFSSELPSLILLHGICRSDPVNIQQKNPGQIHNYTSGISTVQTTICGNSCIALAVRVVCSYPDLDFSWSVTSITSFDILQFLLYISYRDRCTAPDSTISAVFVSLYQHNLPTWEESGNSQEFIQFPQNYPSPVRQVSSTLTGTAADHWIVCYDLCVNCNSVSNLYMHIYLYSSPLGTQITSPSMSSLIMIYTPWPLPVSSEYFLLPGPLHYTEGYSTKYAI